MEDVYRLHEPEKGLSKGPFPSPLTRIDQVVDSTMGSELLSFLDAYAGYHQITMKESDQHATSFITHFSTFYYVSMPFGLKMLGYVLAMYALMLC